MGFLEIFLLAVVQGLTELLPVSSSAHVIIAERLLQLDPASPEMTFLLVILHSGTMTAVIFYFWNKWKSLLVSSASIRRNFLIGICVATALTGFVGVGLKYAIERYFLAAGAEIETLFGNIFLISASLAAAGTLIIVAGLFSPKTHSGSVQSLKIFSLIGAIQGLCLPFRGFSRSGSTISVGLLLGVSRSYSEEFSFVLAVILTPPILFRETMRLSHFMAVTRSSFPTLLIPALFGFFCSFVTGLTAIHWLSAWLERGKWYFFGIYCLGFSVIIVALRWRGYL